MKLFLSHRIDSFGFLDSYYFGVFEDGSSKEFTIEEILNYEFEIVTYELSSLLDQLRFVYNGKLPFLTDISQILKLNAGRSKKSYPKNDLPWFFWNRLKHDLGEELTLENFKIIRTSEDQTEILAVLKILAETLISIYRISIDKLTESNQLTRFNQLENLIQQILNRRQIEGITIDSELLDTQLKKIEVNKDALIHKLRYTHKITNLNYKALRVFLIEKGFDITSKDYSYFNLLSFLKAAKISSILCNDIYNTLRAKADYESLCQYIPEDEDIIYPNFDCIGTVTSRILITTPHIQQLKRENRIIFKAKNDFTLLYCDYKQFEPGILASSSKDSEMISLYNSEDIYENFSEYIFGTKTLRKEAKVIFLSYLYGMSDKRLVSVIDGVIKSKGLTTEISAAAFFDKFKDLDVFKQEEFNKMIENGYIQTETSLRRNVKKTEEGKGKKSETRFVLSQIIQGTASYILKKALLDVMKDDEIEFLVPMHDAVLFQVPTSKEKEKRDFIEKCFVENYKIICPEINAKVDFKPFDE